MRLTFGIMCLSNAVNIWNDLKKKKQKQKNKMYILQAPDETAEPWGIFLNLAKNITVSFIVPVFLKSWVKRQK